MARFDVFLVVIVTVAAILLPTPSSSLPEPPCNEVYWSSHVAKEFGGQVEFRTYDGARIDILTPAYAIEVDWAKKWAEGVGQAAYYGCAVSRKPVLILLIKNRKAEIQYISRAMVAGAYANVDIWLYDISSKQWINRPNL